MALLATQQVQITGPAITHAAAAASDTITPGDRVFAWVKTAGTATTATVTVPGTQYGQARADVPVAIGTNSERLIGPLVADLADPATGVVTLTCSPTTAVTVAAVTI